MRAKHELKPGIVVALLLSLTIQLQAQVFQVDTLAYSGNPSNRINLVIMGDGYALTDTTKFRTDALNTANYFLSIPPFNEYRNFFNFFAIEVISNDSGNDHPGNGSDEPNPVTQPITAVDNYLESSFDFGVHRCVYSNNTGLVFSIANTNFPQYDLVNVIVNTTYYGGCGGNVAFTTMNTASSEIFVHEFGHSFGSLSDEYEYGSSNCAPGNSQGINVTQETDSSILVWKNWLTTAQIPTPMDSTCNLVGLYEGAQYCYTNWYRPKCNCKMRQLNQPFCEVCIEQFIYKINSLIDLNDDYSPQNTAITICSSDSQLFTITPVRTIPNTVVTTWYVDSIPVLNNDTSYVFNASLFSAGIHQVKAVSYDSTAEAKKTLFPYQQVWNVNLVNPVNGLAFTVIGDTLASPYIQSQWYVIGNSTPVSLSDLTVCNQTGNYYVVGMDANGCIATSDTISVICTTGLNEIHSASVSIQVKPNPFNDVISIHSSGLSASSYRITVQNVLGQVLKNEEVIIKGNSFDKEIAGGNLSKGIYFLIISNENYSYRKKIIKR